MDLNPFGNLYGIGWEMSSAFPSLNTWETLNQKNDDFLFNFKHLH